MLFEGKTGLVFGIANDKSIAAAIASQLNDQGAQMGFTHLPDRDPDRPKMFNRCLLYTSPSPRDQRGSRMPSSA